MAENSKKNSEDQVLRRLDLDEETEVSAADDDIYCLGSPTCPSVHDDSLLDTFERSRMPTAPHWTVAWSDLMMTMFIFFVVLYVYQSAHREPEFLGGRGIDTEMGSSRGFGDSGTGVLGEGGAGFNQQDSPQPSMFKVYDLGKQVLEEELAQVASVDLVADKSVRIILTGDLLFNLGRAELKPRAKKSLQKIAGILIGNSYPVTVVGHTDITPIHSEQFPTNWELSVIRASKVTRFLTEEMGIPASRFTISGRAFYEPVLPNNSLSNKAANRRVEIIISKEPLPVMSVSFSNKGEGG